MSIEMICPRCKGKMNKNGSWTDKRSSVKYQKFTCKVCRRHKYYRLGPAPAPVKDPVGISVTELRSRYDNNYKVELAVNKLEKDVFLTESEFIKVAGIRATNGYSAALDDPKWDKNKGRVAGIVYYSHEDSIKQMKNEGILT